MANERQQHELSKRSDLVPTFDIALMLRDESGPSPLLDKSHKEVTVEESHANLEAEIKKMHNNLELDVYESYDRTVFDSLCGAKELDVETAPDEESDDESEPSMYEKFEKTYQPARMKVIDSNIAKRQASRETIDSLLALYEQTKDATLTVEQTIQRVPGQLVAIINQLKVANPEDTDKSEADMQRFNATVSQSTNMLYRHVFGFGNDIAKLHFSQQTFKDAHETFMSSTEYIAKRVDDIIQAEAEEKQANEEAAAEAERAAELALVEQAAADKALAEQEDTNTDTNTAPVVEQEPGTGGGAEFDWSNSTDGISIDLPPQLQISKRQKTGFINKGKK